MSRRLCFLCLLATMAVAGLAMAATEDGFRGIFDGKTLHGWDGDPRLWRVEHGVIVGQTTKVQPASYNSFLIWRGGKPGNFELTAEFRMPDRGFTNSGIQFRSWEGPKKWQVSGYQADMDGGNQYVGNCFGENYRGTMAWRGQKVVVGTDHRPKVTEQFADGKELGKQVDQHGWNEYHIIARGNHIIEKVNGRLMCELTDEDTLARREGIIALQVHAGKPMKVEFRNIRIKDLP